MAKGTPVEPFDTTITGAADILVDGSGPHLGALSYTVPPELVVRVGDAVAVPFGRRDGFGLVLGAGDATKATRSITATFGPRAHPGDIEVCRRLAQWHLVSVAAVAARLAPRKAKGADPLDAGAVELAPAPTRPLPVDSVASHRRFLLAGPLTNTARLAAETAAEMVAAAPPGSSVLILAPSVAKVEAILTQFRSGAARLDAAAGRGAWRGFQEGTVAVGVGTRVAALYSPRQLAGIVVVDAEHPGHVEAAQPHTNAADVAALRSKLREVSYAAIGTSPPAGLLAAGVKVAVAGEHEDWPRVEIVDRSKREQDSKAFPPEVQIAVQRKRRNGGRPVIVAGQPAPRHRCIRCRQDRTTEIGDAMLAGRAAAPCTRCQGTETASIGWDPSRCAAFFDNKVRAVAAADLTRVRNAGLVVILDGDAPSSGATLEPERAMLASVVAAAKAAGQGGTVQVITAHPDDPVLVALAAGDHKRAVRHVWTSAKEAGLPPFGWLVHIRAAKATAPSVRRWPGRVAGPRAAGPGEWEILVRVSLEELAELAGHVEKLRKGAKVRLTVTPGT